MEITRMRDRAEVLRDEMVMRDRIRTLLETEPNTIPEIAQALGKPSWEVTTWVMAMRRYGIVTELPKARADDYYQYALAE